MTDSLEPRAGANNDTERQQRQAALESLARHNQPHIDNLGSRQSASGVRLAGRQTSRRLLTGGILLVLTIGLISAGALWKLYSSGKTSVPPHPTMLVLNVTKQGYTCPTAIAWSPDGSQVAVLAKGGTCTTQNAGHSIADGVLLFDVATGHVLKQFALQTQDAFADSYLAAYSLSWSPDGQTLVLPWSEISLSSGTPTPRATGLTGLYVLSMRSGQVQRLTASKHQAYMTIWTIEHDLPSHEVTSPDYLPDALSYQWTGDGQVVVNKPLPVHVTADDFSGSPHDQPSSQTFSLWQSGVIEPLLPLGSRDAYASPQLFFITAFVRWSPDGQHILVGQPVDSAPLLPLQSFTLLPGVCAVRGFAPCGSRPAPYPDRAFREVVTQTVKLTEDDRRQGKGYAMPVTWRPDGHLLATILPGDNLNQASLALRISLLNTATGQVVATLTPPPLSDGQALPLPSTLFWAPTGNQLAFIETYENQIILWSGARLPTV